MSFFCLLPVQALTGTAGDRQTPTKTDVVRQIIRVSSATFTKCHTQVTQRVPGFPSPSTHPPSIFHHQPTIRGAFASYHDADSDAKWLTLNKSTLNYSLTKSGWSRWTTSHRSHTSSSVACFLSFYGLSGKLTLYTSYAQKYAASPDAGYCCLMITDTCRVWAEGVSTRPSVGQPHG